MPSWQEIFEKEGTLREVTGNAPLPLTTVGTVWLVAAGRVDVFSVPLEAGQSKGARVHLRRVECKQLLVGHVAIAAGTGLVAAGTPETRVWQMSLSRLQELAVDSALSVPLAGLLDEWVRGLIAGVVRIPPPRPGMLESGQNVRPASGTAVSSSRDIVWVRQAAGTSRFLGRESLTISPANGVVPLTNPGWLEAQEGSELHTFSTEQMLAQGTLWAALDSFYCLLLQTAERNSREAAGAERQRLEKRAAYEEKLARATLSSMASVARPDDESIPVVGQGSDPLFVACHLVGVRMGIAIQRPIVSTAQRKRTDPVGAIAWASGVRTRRVILAGDWWCKDNGPLVGFRAADEQPVALLPASPSCYEMVDPTTRKRTPVTPENAASLRPFAYCFYRSFGFRILGAAEILRFGLSGTRRDWLAIILLGMAGSLLGLLVPLATGMIFDQVLPGEERGQLLLIVLGLTASAAAMALFQFVQGISFLRLQTRMDGTVEAGLWDRLLNLPAPFFRQYAAGDLAYRTMGIAAIRQALTEVAVSSLLGLAFSLASFGLLIYYDASLALLAFGIFLAVMAATALAAHMQLGYERDICKVRSKIGGLVLQLLTGISRLRVAGAENRALAVWANLFSQQKKLAFRAREVTNRLAAFNAAVPVLASLALFAAVARMPRESLSLGEFLGFSAAFTQILYAAVIVSGAVSSALQVIPLYEQARPIFESLPEGGRAAAEPGELSGDIEISHVSFRYQTDGPMILDDVSLHIRPGEFIAFVGPSGAGKSTLLRLLLGFESPTAGSIYFDREDLAGLNQQGVRRQSGVVLQNGRLIPGDILSNIVGSSLLTLEDAWEAARLSGLADDIERMPMGMHTYLSEGATTLSGGQRQRLMIARAIVTGPRILFFDEATSALDNATQAHVSRSLERLKVTRVVVAHRLSTIQNADRIYVFDGGKIVQKGSYQELIGQPGLFSELAKRQLV